MTFNVRGSFPENRRERLWENRAQLNVETIQRQHPDLIGFQEVQQANRDVYDEELIDYGVDAGREESGDKDPQWVFFNPIYWRTQRLKRLDSGGFFLSETPDVWSRGWDAAFVRGATWVRFEDQATGFQFVYLNAHLDHVGEESRLASSRLIVSQLDAIAPGMPCIVTADFNSRAWAPDNEEAIAYPSVVRRDALPPGGTVHAIFTDGGFRDTFIEAGHYDQLDMNTFHAFLGDEFPPCSLRIDWILVRDGDRHIWQTDMCDIVRDGDPPVYPSDHYPVVADVRLVGKDE